MTTKRISTIAAALVLALPAVAAADGHGHGGGNSQGSKTTTKPKAMAPALKDCVDNGQLDRVWSRGALQQALRHVPSDVANYTNCVDLLRYAYATGTQVPAWHQTAKLRMRCTGSAYGVAIQLGTTTLGSGTVKACKRGTTIVRVPVGNVTFPRHHHHSRDRQVAISVTPAGASKPLVYQAYLHRSAARAFRHFR